MSKHATGLALLGDPIENKGTAFTAEERLLNGLEGLLPAAVENLDTQIERVMGPSIREAQRPGAIHISPGSARP